MRRALACVALVACKGGDAPAPRAPAPRAPAVAPAVADRAAPSDAAAGAPASAPPPALADAPRVDLRANAVRWHLYDRGLVVPVATEGLRKYDLEYRSGWGDVREVDGRAGRALRGKAVLTVPADGAATVIVRARGHGNVAVLAGKRRLGRAKLDGSWQELAFDAPDLPAGEVALRVEAPKGTLVHSVELAGPAPGCGAGWPALTTPAGALGGAARLSLYVHVPASAFLVATPSGTGAAKVTVTADDGAAATLLDGAPSGRAETWSLDAFAGRLVRLDLEGCGVTWGAPAIALAARPAPPAWKPAQNVVLLVIDALRADHLAAYGDTPVETPRLTAAAKAHGVVFLHNQAMAPSSPPSHMTIHTGQIPRVHGTVGDSQPVHDDAPVLATILHDAGFYTAYAGDNDFAMDKLRHVATWDHAETPYYRKHDKDCAPIIEAGLAQLAKARAAGKRAFVSLLPIEPHVPYRYHEGVTDRYYAGPWAKPFGKKVTGAHLGRIKKTTLTDQQWAQVKGLYDGEVEHVDACYGALEDGLAAMGADADTVIVVTSDHGEGMGERDGHSSGHAYGLHDELVSVPLILLGAGLPAAAISVVTSNLDIAPTVLALLGVPADARMQGESLLPLARAGEPWPNRVVASEYGRSYALRGGRWHLVVDYDGTATLHDTAADPAEARDVSAEAPMARRWLEDAAGLYLAHRTAWHAATWGNLADLAPTSPLAPATVGP